MWTDDARLRAGDYEPWEVEDVRLAIARLTMHKDPHQFLDHTWIDAEPPPADSTHGLAFDHLFLLARQLGVIGRATVRQKVRGVLASAGDSQVGRPDYNPVRTFDPDVIESVIELLDGGGKRDGAADTTKAVTLLAGVKVEDTEQAITEPEVQDS